MHNMFEKTSKTAGIDESTIKTSEINKANKSYPRIFVFHDLLWFTKPCNFVGETRELRSGRSTLTWFRSYLENRQQF